MRPTLNRQFSVYSGIALAALALAAWSGVLLRLGLVNGLPTWASNYVAVRHAHSHLMYFGWVTLGLMALIWAHLPAYTGRPLPRYVGVQMAATTTAALLSFPAFWSNGYGLTTFGSLELPLGSMAAALNVLTWYAFIVLYLRATRRLAVKLLPIRLWDAAVALMTLSTLGLFGLTALVALGVNSFALYQLCLHLFLDLFASGWFTLGLLGVLWATRGQATTAQMRLPAARLALAIVPTFLLAMSPAVVAPSMFWVATLANLVTAGLLARHLLLLWKPSPQQTTVDRLALWCLAVHLIIVVVLLSPGIWRWANGTQLRVFYLHNFLLGWVSSGLLGLLLREHVRQPATARNAVQAIVMLWVSGVVVMLLALLGLGLATVIPIPALLLLRVAAWSSFLPATAALLAWGWSVFSSRALLMPDLPSGDRVTSS